MHETNPVFMTLANAAFIGVLLTVLAQRLRVPAIVPLLLGGVLAGPQYLDMVRPAALGDTLRAIILIAVSIILFEGGMTLDLEGFRRAPVAIRRLLTVGVGVTWLGVAFGLWFFADLTPPMALLGGSLVIVTGPTVIAPILKRIRLEHRLDAILRWEGVLIDPVGVFVAVVTFGYITGQSHSGPVSDFVWRMAVGTVVGVSAGFLLDLANRRRWIPADHLNLVALTSSIFTFWVCEVLASESGLLAVILMGFFLAVRKSPRLKELMSFKQELTDLSIAILFVILAARLDLQAFLQLGWGGVLAVLWVVPVRVVNGLLATRGLDFSARERAFLGWMAPRGIVAASMASLFALNMGPEGRILETFTYGVIALTVIGQGLSAGVVARWLGLQRPEPRGWIIVGAHSFARRLARFIQASSGQRVTLVDTNARAVARAQQDGLEALLGDALGSAVREGTLAEQHSHLLALTDNPALNLLICQRWRETHRRMHLAYWSGGAQPEESAHNSGVDVFRELPPPGILSHELDEGEARLTELARGAEAREGHVLVASSDGVAVALSTPGGEELPGARLTLERNRVALGRLFQPTLVLWREAATLVEVLDELLALHAGLMPGLPVEALGRLLVQRETDASTALGDGVALPHATVDGLVAPRCAVGVVRRGVEGWQGADGQPVRVVVLLLSPKGDPERHLLVLAEIVRWLQEPAVLEELVSTSDEAGLMRLLPGGADPRRHP